MRPRLLTATLWVAAAFLGCAGAWLLLTGPTDPARPGPAASTSTTSTPSSTQPTTEPDPTGLPGGPAPPGRAAATAAPGPDQDTSTATATPARPTGGAEPADLPVPARAPLVDEQSAPTTTGPGTTTAPQEAALDQLRRAFPDHVDPDVDDHAPILAAAWDGLEADLQQAGLADVKRRAALLLDPVTDTTATAVLQVTHTAPGSEPEVRTYQVDLASRDGEGWTVRQIHIP